MRIEKFGPNYWTTAHLEKNSDSYLDLRIMDNGNKPTHFSMSAKCSNSPCCRRQYDGGYALSTEENDRKDRTDRLEEQVAVKYLRETNK